MQSNAYVNRIATAVPDHEVHQFYRRFGASLLADHPQRLSVFERMSDLSGIERRYSCFEPANDPQDGAIDRDGTSVRGSFAGTAKRMEMFEAAAPVLAQKAVDAVLDGEDRELITHLIVTSCTGFSAPGIDLELVQRCGLPTSVERTVVGFMGCYAAINALKLARHIVRAEPDAKVLMLNLELCTLHLQEIDDLEQVLSFMVFADGCSASLVTAEPHGAELLSFRAVVAPASAEQITWRIGQVGFDMHLSGRVPHTIGRELPNTIQSILGQWSPEEIALWAVHPGGRSVLDAVEGALHLCD